MTASNIIDYSIQYNTIQYNAIQYTGRWLLVTGYWLVVTGPCYWYGRNGSGQITRDMCVCFSPCDDSLWCEGLKGNGI